MLRSESVQGVYQSIISSWKKLLFVVVGFVVPIDAVSGAPIVYTGYDVGADSLASAPLATAAAAAFDAAVSGATVVTFETALPPGFSLSAGAITDVSPCALELCGFNTTPGGSMFHLVAATTGVGDSVDYFFPSPIDAFGAYFSGWQIGTQTITYTDGSTEVLDMGAGGNGGVRFFGFTEPGASIASVTYTRSADIVAVDDLRYHVVPEPSTFALAALGIFVIGLRHRKRT